MPLTPADVGRPLPVPLERREEHALDEVVDLDAAPDLGRQLRVALDPPAGAFAYRLLIGQARDTEVGVVAGLVSVQGRRRAIILVASGIDTFSKINYSDARKVTQNSGIPIYIIGTGDLFYKKYEHRLPATDSLTGMPGA